MNDLKINVEASQGNAAVVVFHLGGHLDAQTVRDLEVHFKENTQNGRYKWLIDLSSLDYISSAGLGSFVGVLSELRAKGGDIFFYGLSPKMQKIFKVLGFTRIFRIEATEAEALKHF
jgi:anti-sigma B factor antagonist